MTTSATPFIGIKPTLEVVKNARLRHIARTGFMPSTLTMTDNNVKEFNAEVFSNYQLNPETPIVEFQGMRILRSPDLQENEWIMA